MSAVVNSTHTSQLSQRNSEPTHLGNGDYITLGGPTVTSQPGGEDYKLDAAAGVKGQDTTIPKSVGAEPSHLKAVSEDDDVKYDDEDKLDEDDDLDKELDKIDEFKEVDTDVDVDDLKEDDDKDDEDKDKIDEADENPFAKKDDDSDDKDKNDKKVDEDDDKDDDDKDKLDEKFVLRIARPTVNLTEDVIPAKNQAKVAKLFKEAVDVAVKDAAKKLHAHYKALYEKRVAKATGTLTEQVDRYLSFMADEWVKANKVQIRTSLRTQLAENFLTGLHKLFEDHYIDVPESKLDVVKGLQEQNRKLRSKINEQASQGIRLRRLAENANKARIVASLSRNLSEVQAQQLANLAEGIAYTTAKEFRSKVSTLCESTFKETKKTTTVHLLPEENVQTLVETKETPTIKSTDNDVNALAELLSFQAKNEQ